MSYDVGVQVPSATFQLTHWIMSLISQQDRELAIKAFNHYRDYLCSEIEFYEAEGMLEDSDYLDHVSELPELYALLNWVKLEHHKHSGD